MNRTTKYALLLIILLISAYFRSINLWHGIGNHPDERGMIMDTDHLSWEQLKPNTFHYGSLSYHLLWFSGQAVGAFNNFYRHYDGLFQLGRILAVLFGVVAIFLTYKLGKICFDDSRVGVLASLFLALNTFHLQLSRYYTTDILVTTFSVAALICICSFLKKDHLRYYILAGVWIGLAFTVKISALTLFVPFIVACVLQKFFKTGSGWQPVRYCGYGIVTAIAVVSLVEPYIFLNYDAYVRDNMMQIDMLRGSWKPPYALQYEGSTPYLYHLQQMLFYTMGIPLFVATLIGLLSSIWRQFVKTKFSEIVLVSWIVVVFLASAGGYVKFPRYLLPLYPVLFCFAAASLIKFTEFKNWSKPLGWMLIGFVLSIGSLKALAFVDIYRSDHIYTQASKWIFNNVEKGSIILGVHWEDKLPHTLPGFDAAQLYQMEYPRWELPLFEEETEEKQAKVIQMLAEGDYLIFPTQRTARGLMSGKQLLPDSARLLQLLYAGKLGYELVASLKVYPRFGNYWFNDDLADESLVVYDHPKVMVFRNVEKVPFKELRKRYSGLNEEGHLLDLQEVLSM